MAICSFMKRYRLNFFFLKNPKKNNFVKISYINLKKNILKIKVLLCKMVQSRQKGCLRNGELRVK